jgi:uncharacterized 2Fe-2S/4Fe-4S cluster protein (DUF4445 family)
VRALPKKYGLALDLGTTTVSAELVKLENKAVLAAHSQLNPQKKIGPDILSRLKFSRQSKKGEQKIQQETLDIVENIVVRLCRAAKVKPSEIAKISLVGNCAMQHLFFGLALESLLKPPYAPYSKEAKIIPAQKLKLNLAAKIYSPPLFGGFVGSDAWGLLLESKMWERKDYVLAIDLGTNGNIVFGNRKKIWLASTCAGGAFEGWQIKFGAAAKPGAILSIEERKGRLKLKIQGQKNPSGICGSALIDALAIMLKKGIIDQTGRMYQDKFILHNKIAVYPEDVREIQLAKAAIRAGSEILQKAAGQKAQAIFIAGNFGNYLNLQHAQAIGLIPRIEGKTHFIGNAALKGARQILLSPKLGQSLPKLARKVKYVPLGTHPDFAKEFAKAMHF